MKQVLKICGLMRKEDILAVNSCLPEYIGFVFAESRRQIDERQALEMKTLLNPEIRAVGVFVNESPDRICELLDRKVIDLAQLHGKETEEEIRYIRHRTGKKVIKAVSVKNLSELMKWDTSEADCLLFDQGNGGSGKSCSWDVVREYLKIHAESGRQPKPFFLAGGIGMENIREALTIPSYGIDLSSGAETNGQKDPELIRQLTQIVHNNMEV